jgi:beta-xylosidase
MNRFSILVLLLSVQVSVFARPMPDRPSEKEFAGYLFAYFTGNSREQEQIHFAVSRDGYRYFALNGNRPVIASSRVSSSGGVRDPHIVRTEDGRSFYMVATDMVSAGGWDSNRAMVLLRSEDLIRWRSTVINIQEHYDGHEDLKRVWAPQTIYDPQADRYMVYWSMKHGDGPDIIYYAYANADFTGLEGEPKPLFIPSDDRSCIDGDIVFHDGLYHLFYKTEGHGNGIRVACSSSLTSGRWDEDPDYKQQTDQAVEGSCVFRLTGTGSWILMYDVYGRGRYDFCRSTDLQHFTPVDSEVSMDFHPRHGTVMPITAAEIERLTGRWRVSADFSAACVNPVIPGYYADPEILRSEKDGRYYLYPTSDGFEGWSGSFFKAFSSDNLTDWKDEGIVLDLKTNVPWAGRNAWAPTIIEKRTSEGYRYYYYFTGAQKIGVALSDSPVGPFVDSGRPLIDFKPAGVTGGQEIDPDVFHDPVGGRDYLYWGNGYLAGAELNPDGISVDRRSVKVMTPDATFREAAEVFYRDGLYYFLWSENDTRDVDYRVRYATSSSPLGPLVIPRDNLILTGRPERGIYGTGHCSVLQIPERDEWYIVYHRFGYPEAIRLGRAAGYHREVCIDRLHFNGDGSIRPVEPTL